MGHPDLLLQFQGKVGVEKYPLDHFFGPHPVLVTPVTPVTPKNVTDVTSVIVRTLVQARNARSLKTRFALSERFTASSIEESLSRK